MQVFPRSVVVFAFFALASSFVSGSKGASPAYANGADDGISLGGYPLCEASAALIVRCPDARRKKKGKKKSQNMRKKACILVADNEIEDRLFLFETGKSGRTLRNRKQVDIGVLPPRAGEASFELSDIEALARYADGTVLIVGSHSRNSRCEIRPNRRIFAGGRFGRAAFAEPFLETVTPKKSGERFKCKRLFGDDRGADLEKVCAAIKRAEKHADEVVETFGDVDDKDEKRKKEQKSACEKQPAFNIEGALVQSVGDDERLWVGLRAPLVDEYAVLLRQTKKGDAFKFDAAAFIDLDRRGIRELTIVGETLWVIAGPDTDAKESHILWRMDLSALKPGARVRADPEEFTELPKSAEGLVIQDNKAFVFMDGHEPVRPMKDGKATGEKPMICKTPGTYKVIDIPG